MKLLNFLARCIECQQVKAKHQHPIGLLQPLPIPNWKYEFIRLNFKIVFPTNQKQNDSIMVVVDKLSKESHFIPVKTPHKATNNADIFMNEIFRLHGISKVISYDREPKFTGNFWKSLFKGLDTKLNFSTAYHLQMYGQTERVNQVLEDMLRMYVRDSQKVRILFALS